MRNYEEKIDFRFHIKISGWRKCPNFSCYTDYLFSVTVSIKCTFHFCCNESYRWNGEQCRPWSDCSLRAVWSGNALWALVLMYEFSNLFLRANRNLLTLMHFINSDTDQGETYCLSDVFPIWCRVNKLYGYMFSCQFSVFHFVPIKVRYLEKVRTIILVRAVRAYVCACAHLRMYVCMYVCVKHT